MVQNNNRNIINKEYCNICRRGLTIILSRIKLVLLDKNSLFLNINIIVEFCKFKKQKSFDKLNNNEILENKIKFFI
jgi:hypothetical protein